MYSNHSKNTKLLTARLITEEKFVFKTDDITIDLAEIKRVIMEFYEQSNTSKLHDLDEMDEFLERHKLLKLIQEVMEI